TAAGTGGAPLRRDDQRLRGDAGLRAPGEGARPLGDRGLHPRPATQPARDARRRAAGGAAGARDGGRAMNAAAETPLGLERLQQRALVVGVVALGACATAGLANPPDFFRAYLIGYLYCLGIALGSLVILMLHYLSGGAWGLVGRRILEAATRTLPLLAVLFLPVWVGVRDVYRLWAVPVTTADDPLRHARAYLNVPFFRVRALIYFGAWLGCAYIFNKWSRERDARPDPNPRRFRLLAGPGLALYGLTITFASIDWAMSLEPHWYSTIYPVLFAVGQALTGMAFAVVVMIALAGRPPLAGLVTPAHLRDLGNLLLMFVMFWAYMSFSQFLLIWAE